MPLVLDELRAYFATVRKFQTHEHIRSANLYDDDEKTDCIQLSPVSDQIRPSSLFLMKRSAYDFDYSNGYYQDLYNVPYRLRFQDARPMIEGRVYNFGAPIGRAYSFREPEPLRDKVVRITLTHIDVKVIAA